MSSSTAICKQSKEWHSHSNELRRQERFTDVVIKAGSERFHCHRIVLASTTGYFRSMFGANYSEASEREIELKGMDAIDFELLLTRVYGDSVALNENANAYRLLRVSHYLGLDSLEDLYADCVRARDTVPLDGAIRIFLMAGRIGNATLEREFAKRLAKDFAAATQRKKLLQISPSAMFKIFCEPVSPSEVILDFLIEWMKFWARTDTNNEEKEEDAEEDATTKEFLSELMRVVFCMDGFYAPYRWVLKMMLENNALYREAKAKKRRARKAIEVTADGDGGESAAASTVSTTNENSRCGGDEYRLFSDIEDDDNDADFFCSRATISESLPFTLYTHDYDSVTTQDCVNKYKLGRANEINLLSFGRDDLVFKYESIEFCKSLLVDGVPYTMTICYHFTEEEDEEPNASAADWTFADSSHSRAFGFVPFVQHEFKYHRRYSSGHLHDHACLLEAAVTAYDRSIYCHMNGQFYVYDCEVDCWMDGEAEERVPVRVKTNCSNLVCYERCLYVVGGEVCATNYGKYENRCNYFQRYDFREKECVLLAGLKCGRVSAASCVHDDQLYVSGGRNLVYFKGGIECYDFRAGKWRLLETSMPRSKFNHTLVPYDNKLWFFGGENHSSLPGESLSDLSWYSYDLKQNEWSKIHFIDRTYGSYKIDRILDVTVF